MHICSLCFFCILSSFLNRKRKKLIVMRNLSAIFDTNDQTSKVKEMEIHVGHLIKEVFDRQGRRATWFASELNCNRANIYNIFNRENIDVEMLIKISLVLQYNFFQDVANLIDDKTCQKSLDNMSENLIQND